MNVKSETNWAKVDAMTDDDIDFSDIPELGDEFFARARIRLPDGNVVMKVRVPRDVLAWYHSQGKDVEERMASVLRAYAEGQKTTSEPVGASSAT